MQRVGYAQGYQLFGLVLVGFGVLVLAVHLLKGRCGQS